MVEDGEDGLRDTRRCEVSICLSMLCIYVIQKKKAMDVFAQSSKGKKGWLKKKTTYFGLDIDG